MRDTLIGAAGAAAIAASFGLMLYGGYLLYGWWGPVPIIVGLAAFGIVAVLNHLAHRRARAMCPVYQREMPGP